MNPVARIGLAVASAAAVAVLVATAEPNLYFPLISVPQGVSVVQIQDERVFLVREGSIIRPIRGVSTDSGEPVVWCPNEEAFVAPTDTSLWNLRGEWVAGPAKRDLDLFPHETTTDLQIRVDVDSPGRRGRSTGTISGEAGQRYQRFAAGDDFAFFCQDAVPRAPDAVPQLP